MRHIEGVPDIRCDLGEIVFSEQQIAEQVAALGEAVSCDYAKKSPILIGVLNGVVMFMADLLRYITVPVSIDFMAISSYGSNSNGDNQRHGVRITKDLDQSITGRHVLFVEDVIDTGLTLDYLLRTLRTRKPASIETCVLFDRPYRRLIEIPVKYRGFELPDRFVVGYGLDAHGLYRNLPFVGLLANDAQESQAP